jgi:hypothetical protein
MIRVRAGISYALTEAVNDGHCGLPVEELHALAERLLEVPVALIETAITLETGEQSLSPLQNTFPLSCHFLVLAQKDFAAERAIPAGARRRKAT